MPEGTPLANLWLPQARMMRLQLPRFADSIGMIEEPIDQRRNVH
ncbi:hypothetical protein FHS27_005303 [Rhodopirellula rubra]|uniref:Uncharacterized protein n=1 Tax=Aporhodopirellula rubra TaxID=980271 RepID=A0A7W5E3J8_9BACT|nr:hypothetical protein [Aporhodopirellula rubra]